MENFIRKRRREDCRVLVCDAVRFGITLHVVTS